MDAVTRQESGGNGLAVSSKGAIGSTQMKPETAKAMATKLGIAYRPDLLYSNTPQGLQYQRQLGSAYLQEGYDKTGNLRDALHYYHGGPDRQQWGPKTQAYANSVMSRLGVQ